MRRNKTAGRRDRRDESMTAGCEEFQILRGRSCDVQFALRGFSEVQARRTRKLCDDISAYDAM
jgi:hypothetical protein